MYLSYGMTFEQFWYGEPDLVKYYREAHDIKIEEQNSLMHLQGIYVKQAIGDFIEFYAMVNHPRIREGYPKKPYPITARRKRQDDLEQEEAVANYYINLFKKQELSDKEIVGEEL